MKELLKSITIIKIYNNEIDLNEAVIEFENYSGQKIPSEIIDNFRFSGLNNVDFFTSDYLNRFGIKNLLQL